MSGFLLLVKTPGLPAFTAGPLQATTMVEGDAEKGIWKIGDEIFTDLRLTVNELS